jgi:hypothetical protein
MTTPRVPTVAERQTCASAHRDHGDAAGEVVVALAVIVVAPAAHPAGEHQRQQGTDAEQTEQLTHEGSFAVGSPSGHTVGALCNQDGAMPIDVLVTFRHGRVKRQVNRWTALDRLLVGR